MFRQDMKENLDKKIDLTQFSESTIAAFIDFLYLGGKECQTRIASGELKVDVVELFEFAHTYQLDILKDCCFNLFCLLSTPENAKQIASLGKTYSDHSLKMLAKKLNSGIKEKL